MNRTGEKSSRSVKTRPSRSCSPKDPPHPSLSTSCARAGGSAPSSSPPPPPAPTLGKQGSILTAPEPTPLRPASATASASSWPEPPRSWTRATATSNFARQAEPRRHPPLLRRHHQPRHPPPDRTPRLPPSPQTLRQPSTLPPRLPFPGEHLPTTLVSPSTRYSAME